VTSDIDAVQGFITSGLLGALVNSLTLVGMVGVMLYLNWQFTLVALSVAPLLFVVVYTYTRRIKKASREVRKKEGEIVSVIEEVLSSIRVVKAFAGRTTNSTAWKSRAWRASRLRCVPAVSGPSSRRWSRSSWPSAPAWCCGSARAWCSLGRCRRGR
jgi:ABC-type multidrug transport system fused ATPase/permease subunit